VRYLVTVESIDVGPLLPPQQVAGIIRTAVWPTSEALSKLESEGKIRGGVVAGASDAAFILDAESNEEATMRRPTRYSRTCRLGASRSLS
jgi:hypothetical protein